MDPLEVKKQFPALSESIVVYLDSAATTQLPEAVLLAMSAYERGGRGNAGKGLYGFAALATAALADSRQMVADFIGAKIEELIFTKSTTEGLNLLARSLAKNLGPGDEVVLTIFEHHANLLPWRELATERGFTLKFLALDRRGGLDLAAAQDVITPRTKVVAACYVSNVLGTILPVAELASLAHAVGAVMVVDAAQAVGHLPIDVQELACDALVFGGHKMYGPDGIGSMYISPALRSKLGPMLYGGGMVDEVWAEGATYADDYRLFEAGSANVTGAVGLAAACRFLQALELTNVRKHESELRDILLQELERLPSVTVYGPQATGEAIGIVSFSVQGVHPHDVAQILADHGVAVRAGYHCAAPLARCLHEAGTVRVSFGVYSSRQDIDKLLLGLRLVTTRLGV